MNNTITEIKKRKTPRGNYHQIRYYRRIQKQSGDRQLEIIHLEQQEEK